MNTRGLKLENGERMALSVLECGSPLPLSTSYRLAAVPQSARGPAQSQTRRLRLIYFCFLLSALSFRASGQSYSIDWHKVSGGGGTSTGGVYSVSGTVGQHDAGGPMTGGKYSLTGGFWAILSAVPTPGAPTLLITQSGNNAVISWQAPASGFVLESNPDLTAANNWSTVSPDPVAIGGFNYVTNTITPGNNFYRLHHP